LPVEFDASRRALQWLGLTGIQYGQNVVYASDALKWAALTYVVAALGSLATLFFYLGFLNNNDQEKHQGNSTKHSSNKKGRHITGLFYL